MVQIIQFNSYSKMLSTSIKIKQLLCTFAIIRRMNCEKAASSLHISPKDQYSTGLYVVGFNVTKFFKTQNDLSADLTKEFSFCLYILLFIKSIQFLILFDFQII
jgi:hypothetical protein